MVKQVVHLKSRLQQAWEASRAYARLPGRDRPWWLWALIGAAVLTIFMIFGILIMLNFGRVIYVLLLAWVAAQTLLFLLMAYLVPPPEPLSRRSTLVVRLVQFCRIIFSAFLLGVSAFWGAVLGADVQHSYPSISQFTAIMRTAVTWPMSVALGFGLFYFVGALAVDIIRTQVSVRRRCAEGVLKMCAARMGGVSGGPLEGVWCFLSRCWLAELKAWPLVIFSAVISVVAIPCFLVRLVRWMVEAYSTFMAGG